MILSEGPSFLRADSLAAAEIRAIDWRATSLGAPEGWPTAVRSLLATWLDSPQAMFVAWGPELRLLFNDAYRPFLGARAAGAMGLPFAQIWPEIWPDVEPIVRKALDGIGSRFEDMPLTMTRNGYAEQTWWTFTYMPLRDEQGQVIGMLCTCAEATAQVLAKRQAVHERTRQRQLLQQMPGFVAVLAGPEHVYEYANDAYQRLVGPRHLIGQRVRDALPELSDQGYFELLDRVYRSGDAFSAEALPVRLSGELRERYVDLLFHPVRDDRGEVAGIFVGGYEVTSRVQAERQLRTLNETLENRVEDRTAQLMRAQESLRQSQKLEALGQLTGGVAHDFNNLMTVIGSSVELLRRPNLPEERRQRYLEAINDTVRRASRLTSQLLAFARRQPLRPQVFEVAPLVEGIVDLIRPLVGARVQVDFGRPAQPCFAQADINQFETALMNLAINARDAMSAEGRLAIAVSRTEGLPGARRVPGRTGAFVAVSVSDTGVGIPREQLQQIFEPFYTTKEIGKGTGLGLSQVIGFAQQSGGDVFVESTPGRGSTFTLYLPSAAAVPDPEHVEEAPAQPSPQPPRPGLRILVVEDNLTVGQFSTALLDDLGFDTEWVTDAQQALERLAEGEARFDLVFSDVIMPGMDGLELASVLRERYPQLPVLLTSGYSEMLAKELPAGLELVQKPYSVEVLAAAIARITG